MTWIKEIIANTKAMLLAPVTNVLCVAGVILIGISFLDYDKANGLSLHGQFHTYSALAGLILMLIGVLLFYLTSGSRLKNGRLDYNKGVEIKRQNLTILIKTGEIQSIAATRNAVIVLPANTAFVDDCATDKRTALGAFFLDRFPEEVSTLPSLFSDVLTKSGFQPDARGLFAAGTSIILPDSYAKPAKIVITASTLRMSDAGITSNPHIICSCVENIFKCTANQRVDTLFPSKT